MTKTLNLRSIAVQGIDHRDAPDFVDAYIDYAEWEDGTPLTEEELGNLNEDSSFVYEQVINKLY